MESQFLFFDIETTGLIKAKKHDIDFRKSEQFPHIVQLSWQLVSYDHDSKIFTNKTNVDYIIRPKDYTIPPDSSKIHGITQEIADSRGIDITGALENFMTDLTKHNNTYLVCHNIEFDVTILFYHIYKNFQNRFVSYKDKQIPCVCTMLDTVSLCKLPSMSKFKNPNDPYKYPKLSELYKCLFGNEPTGRLHNSMYDVECMIECFKELMNRKLLTVRNANLVFE